MGKKIDIEMYSTHNEGKSGSTEIFKKINFINVWLQYQKMFLFIN